MWSRARGFTLLEILLVMTLAALIMTVVPASMNGLLPHLERQAEVKALVMYLRGARGTAIRERREVTVLLDPERRQYRLTGSGNATQLPDGVLLEYSSAFDSAGARPPHNISFFADGSSTGGTIWFGTADTQYEIHIDWLSGRVGYREKV